MSKLILDLCGGTGAWSEPYRQAGYNVQVITLPDDVRLKKIWDKEVHGILAAPPCTEFARCGARWWASKGEGKLLEGLSIVDACLRIVTVQAPSWWALENPVGRLQHYLGRPQFTFDPWEFGDPWTKKTWLWGRFNAPKKLPLAEKPQLSVAGRRRSDWIHRLGPSKNRSALRSITPPGFAQAFFEANP